MNYLEIEKVVDFFYVPAYETDRHHSSHMPLMPDLNTSSATAFLLTHLF